MRTREFSKGFGVVGSQFCSNGARGRRTGAPVREQNRRWKEQDTVVKKNDPTRILSN